MLKLILKRKGILNIKKLIHIIASLIGILDSTNILK